MILQNDGDMIVQSVLPLNQPADRKAISVGYDALAEYPADRNQKKTRQTQNHDRRTSNSKLCWLNSFSRQTTEPARHLDVAGRLSTSQFTSPSQKTHDLQQPDTKTRISPSSGNRSNPTSSLQIYEAISIEAFMKLLSARCACPPRESAGEGGIGASALIFKQVRFHAVSTLTVSSSFQQFPAVSSSFQQSQTDFVDHLCCSFARDGLVNMKTSFAHPFPRLRPWSPCQSHSRACNRWTRQGNCRPFL